MFCISHVYPIKSILKIYVKAVMRVWKHLKNYMVYVQTNEIKYSNITRVN